MELSETLPHADAFGNQRASSRVVAAAAAVYIEQFTSDAGEQNFSGILVLQFMQTASAAAVAQRFPLRLAQFREGFIFPKAIHYAIIPTRAPQLKSAALPG